jgi:hypothetical protein
MLHCLIDWNDCHNTASPSLKVLKSIVERGFTVLDSDLTDAFERWPKAAHLSAGENKHD